MPETSPELDRLIDAAAEGLEPQRRQVFTVFAARLLRGVDIHQAGGVDALQQVLREAFETAERREPGAIQIRVHNPEHRPGHTVLEVLQDDRPFIVDSVHLVLRRMGLQERMVIHPILTVTRDDDGLLTSVGVDGGDGSNESFLQVEISPAIEDPAHRSELEMIVRQTMEWVRDTTDDHRRMIRTLREVNAGLEYAAPFLTGGPERIGRIQRFLSWIADGRFVLIGMRRYRLSHSGGVREVQIEPGTGLGMWRDDASSRLAHPLRGDEIPLDIRDDLDDPRILLISKSYMESRIHRPGRLDRILVKEHDDQGRATGFTILVGLYTLPVLRTPGSQIPLLAERLMQAVERMGVTFGSHEHKAVVAAFDSAPVELLFSSDVNQLIDLLQELVSDAGANSVQLVLRTSPHGRALYIGVLLPREHYREDLRADLRALLVQQTEASYIDDRTSFIDERTAVVHFFCTAREGHRLEPDGAALEHAVRTLCSPWGDRLRDALRERHGDSEGAELSARYGEAFPEALRQRTAPVDAVRDVDALEALEATGQPQFALYFDSGDDERATLTLRMYLTREPLLSDVLPAVDRYGIRVVDAQLSHVRAGGKAAVVESLRILPLGADQDDIDAIAPRLSAALAATFSRAAPSDSLDGLVLGAGLDWREVDLMRAYLEYFAQLQGSLSRPFLRKVLRENPLAVRLLVKLFEAHHDPSLDDAERASRAEQASRSFESYRDRIDSLNEDRALSGFFNLVEATLRSNHFAPRRDPHRVVLKLDSRRIRELSGVVPYRELFVHSADMTGIHLRGGPVARGGLRWSDRQDDLRVEILGLMSTQMLKNGLIVPVGAKGGFVLRRNGLSPQRARTEADAQYRVFVASLLDLTDNLAPDGSIIPPQGVRRLDGDDPYLVVAADKGTAHLSDTANEIALSRDFWLGDAFASGGSEGYDHKEHGITARGAWECVQHHFAELGIDPERDTFTVIGVGDMSGDVFGNGLLLMPRAKLLAAFDHRHVFLDPDPDPDNAWKERKRLFELSRSSWADYDAACLSAGGGVWPRESKSIPIPAALRDRLGFDQEHVSGEKLVRAILCMPVDLLWNGGIGTYVKASHESQAAAGDRANEAVRIDATELRARVVGEGGNLGLTQAGRVEVALHGVRLDTDAIDNSAGVDLSDHEVNYKIALAPLVRSGELDASERHDAIFAVAEEACANVLAHNRSQALALSLDERRSARDRQIFLRAIEELCEAAQLAPGALKLPDAATLAEREPEVGLTRPELAVLLGLAKLQAQAEISRSDLPSSDAIAPLYQAYFPESFRTRFGQALDGHRLHREIGALCLVNRLVDAGGATLLAALTTELGVGLPAAAAALLTAEEVLGIPAIRQRLIDLTDAGREGIYGALIDMDVGVREVARYLMRSGASNPDAAALERWRGGIDALRRSLRDYLSAGERQLLEARRERLLRIGLPEDLALDLASLPLGDRGLNILRICEEAKVPPLEAARSYARLGDATGINWVYGRLAQAEVASVWDRMVLVDLRWALLDLQRDVTENVLASGGHDPTTAVDAFLADNAGCIERVAALERRAATDAGPSALSVIVARLRDLQPSEVRGGGR